MMEQYDSELPPFYCEVRGEHIVAYATASGVPVHLHGGRPYVPAWLVLAWELKLRNGREMSSVASWRPTDVVKWLRLLS